MTPAVKLAKKAGISYNLHSYNHDASCASYGLEAAEKLALDPQRVFKTLVVLLDAKTYVVAVLPVSKQLSLKQIAGAAGAKKAKMAEGADVERITGYLLGGVSPLGQKKRLKTFVDLSAQSYETIFVSAGRRGLEIELRADDLCKLTNAVFAKLVY